MNTNRFYPMIKQYKFTLVVACIWRLQLPVKHVWHFNDIPLLRKCHYYIDTQSMKHNTCRLYLGVVLCRLVTNTSTDFFSTLNERYKRNAHLISTILTCFSTLTFCIRWFQLRTDIKKIP